MSTDLTFFTNEPDAALLDRFRRTFVHVWCAARPNSLLSHTDETAQAERRNLGRLKPGARSWYCTLNLGT